MTLFIGTRLMKFYTLAEENILGRTVIMVTDELKLKEYVDYSSFSKYDNSRTFYIVDQILFHQISLLPLKIKG